MRASLAILVTSLLSASAHAQAGAASAVPCPDPGLLAQAAEADARMRERAECDAADLSRLGAAVRAIDACVGELARAPRWSFPVANYAPEMSIGGRDGNGYHRAPYLPCYATRYPGHPAHDLFVDDLRQKSRDPQGRPFPAVAVEDGVVLVAREGWKPGDDAKGGNYLMIYLPGRKQIAYYAHLDALHVKAGDRVAPGQLVGTIGRTGKNAWPRRSQTHLHFGLWDAASFRPVNSYALLRAARTVSLELPGESAGPEATSVSP